MPVEIKELVIKLKVEEKSASKKPAIDPNALRAEISNQVRMEIKKQLRKIGER